MTAAEPLACSPPWAAAGAPLSLRDPDGRLVFVDGRPFRFVRQGFAEHLRGFLKSESGQQFERRGALVGARELALAEVEALTEEFPGSIPRGDWECVFECDRIPFASHAAEWPPSMLYAAAQLTLTLGRAAVAEGLGLKDATPSNVLFRGTMPVFVDLLSFERRDAEDAMWRPYAQFVSGFLIPLLLYRHTTITPRMIFSDRRDGIAVDVAAGLLPPLAKLRWPGRSLVTMPMVLGSVAERLGERLYESRRTDAPRARWVLGRLFDRLEEALSAVEPSIGASRWTRYENETHAAEYRAAKHEMVAEVLDRYRPTRVLDIGCNIGEYSVLAARAGSSVVAIDSDVSSVEHCARRARAESLDILPLVVDIAAPTPAAGWANGEELAFLARSRTQFDLVLGLAILHHLVVGARVPLPGVLELLATMSKGLVLLEFVGEADPLSRKLARGRSFDGSGLTVNEFETACREVFTIESAREIAGSGRVLYALSRRAG